MLVYVSVNKSNTLLEPVYKKGGHIVNLTCSAEACMIDLTNSETQGNHTGWSEIKAF